MPVGIPLVQAGRDGFLLGTDEVGRDIFSRLLFGMQASWFAALVVIASACPSVAWSALSPAPPAAGSTTC